MNEVKKLTPASASDKQLYIPPMQFSELLEENNNVSGENFFTYFIQPFMISFKAHAIANHAHLTVAIACMCSSVEAVHMHEKRHGWHLHVWSGDLFFFFF